MKPIIFDGESVRDILDGSKTQTRRVVRPQPIEGGMVRATSHGLVYLDCNGERIGTVPYSYGKRGDRLWVREAHIWGHAPNDAPGQGIVQYGPDDVRFHPDLPRNLYTWARIWRKRPAIHMPRWASRITLEITAVRVERVQDINHNDAAAEGCNYGFDVEFEERWDTLNKRRGFGWDSTPWVWVISFRRVQS